MRGLRTRTGHAILAGCSVCLVIVAAQAQEVTVTVDAARPINVLTQNTWGVMLQIGDAMLTNPALPNLLHPAGLNTIRYPDGWDGQADLFHWSTYRPNKSQTTVPPRTAYFPPANDFGHFVPQEEAVGSAILTVNYGTNQAGNAGGDPQEAAAWVAYANGKPGDPRPIGADAAGHDWNTVGYWAAMRAAVPLEQDDGYNFLRIHHAEPLHILLWEIGNQVYNNGYYGADHNTETDWHAAYTEGEKDNNKRRKNPHLSPGFYGARVVEFSRAMKAVDPAIKIGASLVMPELDYTWAPDWDQEVLKTSCASIDFVSLQWSAGNQPLPPDYKHMDETALLAAPQTELPKAIQELLYVDKKNCPSGHTPGFAFSQVGRATWDVMDDPQTGAIFAADSLALLAEMGTIDADWFQFHDNSLFTDANKPLPTYYGIQMLHIIAYKPGDQFLSVTPGTSTLTVYATHRRDGPYGVMLLNKDPKNPVTVNVAIKGASLQATGVRFDYGAAQVAAGSGPARSEFQSVNNTVKIIVPPYALVDLLAAQAK